MSNIDLNLSISCLLKGKATSDKRCTSGSVSNCAIVNVRKEVDIFPPFFSIPFPFPYF